MNYIPANSCAKTIIVKDNGRWAHAVDYCGKRYITQHFETRRAAMAARIY